MLISEDTQFANFQGNPLLQATKQQHLNNSSMVKNNEKLCEEWKRTIFFFVFWGEELIPLPIDSSGKHWQNNNNKNKKDKLFFTP